MTDQSNQVSLSSWLILLLLSFVWGSSFILMKKALISFDSVQVASLRVTISSLAFIPILLFYRKKIDWTKFWIFLLVGLTGSGIPSFLYATAQTQISSSLAGLFNSLTPIFTLIFGLALFKVAFEKSKLFGVLLGFLGAFTLFFFENNFSNGQSNIWYSVLVVFGTMCYAISVNSVKHFFQNTSSIIVSAVSFFLIGPPAAIILAGSGVEKVFVADPFAYQALGYVALLSLFGTVMSTILFFKVVQQTNAVFASSVSYIIPIVAIFWGYVDGEFLSWYHFSGMALILVGVYVIKRK